MNLQGLIKDIERELERSKSILIYQRAELNRQINRRNLAEKEVEDYIELLFTLRTIK